MKFSIPKKIPLSETNKYQLRITHYYGLCTIEYTGLIDFIIFGITKYEVLKYNINKIFNKTSQFVFNKRKLVTFDRISLLRTMINYYFNNRGKSFSRIDLMNMIHSIRWIHHPDADQHKHKLQLFIDSFVETGEVKKINDTNYIITGRAITTLSKYEEQERRHTENIKLQRRIVWLTLAIVLAGLVQAYVTYINK